MTNQHEMPAGDDVVVPSQLVLEQSRTAAHEIQVLELHGPPCAVGKHQPSNLRIGSRIPRNKGARGATCRAEFHTRLRAALHQAPEFLAAPLAVEKPYDGSDAFSCSVASKLLESNL